MRAPVLLFSLLLGATAVTAAPTLRVSTERVALAPGMVPRVFIENTSPNEPAHDVITSIEVPEGLTLGQYVLMGEGWRCAVDDRRGSCTVTRLEPGGTALVSFTPTPTTREGARFTFPAIVTARDLGTVGLIDFSLLTVHQIAVTTSGDFGAGTLRAAIEEVNDDPRCGTEIPCHISILPMTIAPATPLPAIGKCNVRIDGGDGAETPLPVKSVALSGENATHGNGLEIRAACADGVGGVVIHGLAIHSWPEHGVAFVTPAPHANAQTTHVINRSYIGTDVTGMLARGNGMRGVATFSPYDAVVVTHGIISANGLSGITLWNGRRVSVSSMLIGTDRASEPLPNGGSGIASFGVPLEASFNLIAHNRHYGIALTPGTAEAALTFNNFNGNAGLAIDWNLDGRTLPDDETDRIPNAPTILDAFYDAGSGFTIIRGSLRIRPGAFGSSFSIDGYDVMGNGSQLIRMPLPEARSIALPTEGETTDVAFEISIRGDRRGSRIALQAQFERAPMTPLVSSEISEAAVVR